MPRSHKKVIYTTIKHGKVMHHKTKAAACKRVHGTKHHRHHKK